MNMSVRLNNCHFFILILIGLITPTGNNESDKEVKKAVMEVIGVIKSFNNHFNESLMFQGNPEKAKQLKVSQ